MRNVLLKVKKLFTFRNFGEFVDNDYEDPHIVLTGPHQCGVKQKCIYPSAATKKISQHVRHYRVDIKAIIYRE